MWQKVKRAAILPNRYGFSTKKFANSLASMVSLLKKHQAVGTFPITAAVLCRHKDITEILDGMEVAVHGLNHRDISGMDRNEQQIMMNEALTLFRERGIEPVGFRAPYLKWSGSILEAAATAGFLYDSSIPVGWSCGEGLDSKTGMKKALESYGVRKIGIHVPTKRANLVEIPVAVPDDEILIDRLGITSKGQLTDAFTSMTLAAANTGGHLVLQLHPERFRLFDESLEEVLRLANDKNAWIAPLKKVAEWWAGRNGGDKRWPGEHPFAITISGDIDAITLGDFLVRRFNR